MRPILSIAIPVYNCEDSIGKNLEEILIQIKDKREIEIIISDNASTDNSLKIVKNYARMDDRIRVLESDTNEGMDRNVFKAVQAAKGMYVHIMSADDFYIKGSINRILEIITKHPELDIVILSNNYINVFNNKIIMNSGKEDVFCYSGGELLEKEELKALCLSNIVVKNTNVENIESWSDGIGLLWPHLYIMSQVIKSDSKAYIFSYKAPLITIQFGNQGWVKKDAICTYYRAALLYEKMIKKCNGYGRGAIRTILTSVISPATQKSDNIRTNIKMIREFYRLFFLYYGKCWFINWIKFSGRLLLGKKKDFFSGLK